MTMTPDPDDRDEEFDHPAGTYPPLLGLDGRPVEITDEKLHELIDAMRDVNPDSDHQLHNVHMETGQINDYTLVLNAMAGLGAITAPNDGVEAGEVIPVVLLGVDFICPNCEKLHRDHLAFRVVEGLPDLFDRMAIMARGVIANGYQLPT